MFKLWRVHKVVADLKWLYNSSLSSTTPSGKVLRPLSILYALLSVINAICAMESERNLIPASISQEWKGFGHRPFAEDREELITANSDDNSSATKLGDNF